MQTFNSTPRMSQSARGEGYARARRAQLSMEWAVTQTGACADDDLGLTRIARYIQRIEHDSRCRELLVNRKGNPKCRRDRRLAKHNHIESCDQCHTWGWPKYVEK